MQQMRMANPNMVQQQQNLNQPRMPLAQMQGKPGKRMIVPSEGSQGVVGQQVQQQANPGGNQIQPPAPPPPYPVPPPPYPGNAGNQQQPVSYVFLWVCCWWLVCYEPRELFLVPIFP